MTGDLTARVTAEVEQQHALLAEWLGSWCDPAVMDEFQAAHSADFTMVSTDGELLCLEDLIDSLRAARNAADGLTVSIDEVRIVAVSGDLVVVAFRETHDLHGQIRRRRSTAVLRQEDAARNGLRWRHVHETAVLD